MTIATKTSSRARLKLAAASAGTALALAQDQRRREGASLFDEAAQWAADVRTGRVSGEEADALNEKASAQMCRAVAEYPNGFQAWVYTQALIGNWRRRGADADLTSIDLERALEGARFERMMAEQGSEKAKWVVARWRALGNGMPKVLQRIVLAAIL